MNICVVFPHQLFELKYLNLPYTDIDHFIIVEDTLFFADTERKLRFNLLKLIYQRASMKYYESYLGELSMKVTYLNWEPKYDFWMKYIQNRYGNNNSLHITNPIDFLLEERIKKISEKHKQKVIYYESPYFLSTNDELKGYYDSLKNKNKFMQYPFYIWQRKRLNLLLDKNQKPIGGKYSYDKYNRDAIPGTDFDLFLKKNKIVLPITTYSNDFYSKAIKYCEKTFENYYPNNYQPQNIYLYPVTHRDIIKHLKQFIKYKLKYFGKYEDAMDFNLDSKHPELFHSVISPQLNNGLITPKYVLQKIVQYFHKSTIKKQILPAIEGYIRQLNWREYSHFLYRYAYDKMRQNYFRNTNKITDNWYSGSTGIIPVDVTIKLAFRYGYIHHILRLMIMCNFMNLCRIKPLHVYQWFMEFSLDSYDWVMINNVYSMGLHADGGVTTTKPYISSSNYVRRMSKLQVGEWSNVWDDLYYNFIYYGQDKFKGRGRLYVSHWKKYKNKKELLKRSKKHIAKLTN